MFTRCAVAAAVLAIGWSVATNASAGVIMRPFGASFSSIGDAPTVEWAPRIDTPANPGAHFGGTIRAVETNGVPNMLVNFDGDPELDGLGDLQATMDIRGSYYTFLNKQYTSLRVDFFYAGDDTLTVGGVSYGKGVRLLSFGLHSYYYDFVKLGSYYGMTGPSTGIAGFPGSNTGAGAVAWDDATPIKVADPDITGRKYIQAGQGSWSGFIVGSFTPEPGTWALMLSGFGMAGVGLRTSRRRREATAPV